MSPVRGEGGGGGVAGVSANEYSCAHHVTWSPNKLWSLPSYFNLTPHTLQSHPAWIRVLDQLSFCIKSRARLFVAEFADEKPHEKCYTSCLKKTICVGLAISQGNLYSPAPYALPHIHTALKNFFIFWGGRVSMLAFLYSYSSTRSVSIFSLRKLHTPPAGTPLNSVSLLSASASVRC
jgi:hypothetical protein